VNDYAGLLSASTRSRLDTELAEFEKNTSNQILVAIFPGLEGESLEDVSIRLVDRWKLGRKGRDNGVLFTVFRDDRQMRIEVGYGLEGALTDALCSQIIRNEISPAFKQGLFDEGVTRGVQAIMEATRGEYRGTGNSKDPMERWAPFVFFAMVAYVFIPLLTYAIVIGLSIAILGLPAGLIFGLVLSGLLHLARAALAAASAGQTYSSRGPRGGGWYGGSGFGGFGGRFGGGGGGGFGGGGASGRW